MTLRTLIFDFDGTLANSLDATLRIANELAPEFGYRPAEPHEIEGLRGASYRTIAAQLGIAWHKIPLIATRIRRELANQVSDMTTFEGLPDVLDELRRRGLQLGVLTSNDVRNVERFFSARGLTGFDFITSSSSVWGKERRLKALLRARKLGAHEVAYVGDEVRDIQATKPLGVSMIAVSWGYTSKAYLAQHAPDFLIDTPLDLLELAPLKRDPAAAPS
ncbi:MAG TPA: HAD-IA family hydrolase [Polyangiales bacterium]|nr:HAD-IA family hydrolase [Polyangiales bacterium]